MGVLLPWESHLNVSMSPVTVKQYSFTKEVLNFPEALLISVGW